MDEESRQAVPNVMLYIAYARQLFSYVSCLSFIPMSPFYLSLSEYASAERHRIFFLSRISVRNRRITKTDRERARDP